MAIACLFWILLLPGCKFDVSLGPTDAPVDSSLIGEWVDPDPVNKRKAGSRFVVSQVPGKNRIKIVWDTMELEGYKIDLSIPNILNFKVEPREDGYLYATLKPKTIGFRYGR